MKLISYLNRVIEYSFYAIFALVPLVFSGSTSELFEFPKMWLTFGLTIIIGLAWFAKMIVQKQLRIQRTSLDIPIILFLLSQIISTIFSLDRHVSLWGYYSRFNGGLYSTIDYLFLYYALVSNFEIRQTLRLIFIGLLSGAIVALWGFPSHFGIDPTCFVFRGNFDTSCWTDAFKPTIRIFSTLGQPAWMAAYMGALIPVALAYLLSLVEEKKNLKGNKKIFAICYLLFAILFYLDLLYTNTRAGFIAFWVADILFFAVLFVKKVFKKDKFIKIFLIVNLLFFLCNFLFGTPIETLNKVSLSRLLPQKQQAAPVQINGLEGTNITDSGKIRLLVWKGAIDTWKTHPLIGTGVETFAFDYYMYKPEAHNLTSEWDFLYNKAHNEYLNYLATTGIFGLGSYLLIILVFIFYVFKYIHSHLQTLNPQQTQNSKNSKNFDNSDFEHLKLFRISDFGFGILIIGLFAGWVSILISNFFGFSVVIINLLFFLTPAFVFIIADGLKPGNVFVFPNKGSRTENQELSVERLRPIQWVLLIILFLISGFLLLSLINYYTADISYANGSTLDKEGSEEQALKPLQDAVNSVPGEPVYKDELSINLATLAGALYLEKDAKSGAKFSQTAIRLSDEVIQNHPNDVVYWKDRVRVFYTLSQADTADEKTYLKDALSAIETAQSLAPNDAKISYNLGILDGQLHGPEKGAEILEQTIKLKPDYRDAYFALGLFYHDSGQTQKAITAYKYILRNLDPHDQQVINNLKQWEK